MPVDAEYCPYDLDRDPGAHGLVEQWSRTDFGLLHLVRSPERTGDRATLFVHGVANTWTTWTPLLRVARELGEEFQDVVLVDLPGFGASRNRLDHLRSKDVGKALFDVVAGLGYTSVRIVGHSMGGFLTLDMASEPAFPIESVHLVSGAYFSVVKAVQEPVSTLFSSPALSIAYWSQGLLAHTGGAGVQVVKLAQKIGLFPLFLNGFAARPWAVRSSFTKSLAHDMRPKYFLLAAANGDHYDAIDRWSRIECPVHAVFGAQDKLVPPRDMTDLRRVRKDVHAHLVERCGHFAHVERPKETYRLLFPGGSRA
ncbi:alpha/beta fold hydrolase [Umezawaea tangerina]|uniref:Pimeloyl-ACP methyl ester carboxylesterase n=1 Tax=Umezawaea tangerina TaxID=84725 RepID=A0A2T0TDA1_9PSEU|nr:alpha/beta hydrolase [Umezawaea tangerina]PRY43630.1 pimeloyl-ACP methyl ester carboxylesterase [Umezawaea tangerina]